MQEMSRLRWLQRRAIIQRSNAGSVLLPCPLPAAPPPSCRRLVCSSSSEGLHRDPAMLWKPCVCQTRCESNAESNSRNWGAPLHQTGNGTDVTDRPAEILFYLSTNMMYSSILMRRLHRWRTVSLKGLHWKSISTTKKKTFKCWAFCKKPPKKTQKKKSRKSRVLLWMLKEHRAILVNLCCNSRR